MMGTAPLVIVSTVDRGAVSCQIDCRIHKRHMGEGLWEFPTSRCDVVLLGQEAYVVL
ncbi:MAG: hypothetical protein ACYDEV_06225 [Acidiferrobacter sp.]